MAEKRILIGIHDFDLARQMKGLAKDLDYQSVVVDDIDKLMAEARTSEYQRVIMDANLGFPGSTNILPAVRAYEFFKPKVEAGLVKFLAISGNDEAVKLTKQRGIPAEINYHFDILDFFE